MLFCFSIASAAVSASDASISTTKDHAAPSLAIGFNMGEVVGNGIVARFYAERSFYQLTYGGYVDKKDDEKYFNVSASYAYYLKKVKASALASPVGLKWVTGGGAVYDNFRGKRTNKINIGTGIGLDFGSVGKTGLIFSLNAIYTLGFDGLRQPEFASLAFEPTLGMLYNFD